MKRVLMSAAMLGMAGTGAAQAACGEVSITEMNWASAQIVTSVSKFLMEQGYGCDVATVPSATVPAVTSLSENGEPDIVTELWLNSTGEVYARLEAEGKVEPVADILAPGGVEGWWVPAYLVEEHPELATVEGIMANPELVGARFDNCPDGWGCRIVNDNLIPALGLEAAGVEIFNHGSAETLFTSLASAYEDGAPWFGYMYGPTAVLGKYDMVKVEIGPIDEEIHAANQNQDNADPGVSDFPPAPVLTVVTAEFRDREPEIAELMSKVSFDINVMNALLAWKDANNASVEETAVHFITENPDTWSGWVSDAARAELSALLQ
ncbi:ABC transporter substrate-binding protein [Rhodovulum sp. YNF3179]|uniref:ABC transporter substrate-binding protein n=1 Tax=Rhodovulum sp. YNF3179 TaxID=3425127 RepID=UPI003D325F4E